MNPTTTPYTTTTTPTTLVNPRVALLRKERQQHGSSLTSVQIRTILNGQCSQTVFTSVKGIVDIVGGVLASGHGVWCRKAVNVF